MNKKDTELHLIYDHSNTGQCVLLNDNLENFDDWVSSENDGGLNMGLTKVQERPLGIEEFFKALDDYDNKQDKEDYIKDLSA